jgi:hypothetical protein
MLMCWKVTIANKSELRLSVVQAGPGFLPGDHYDDINPLEDLSGRPLPLPFVLNGGEAKSFAVHWYMNVPDYVADTVSNIQGQKFGNVTYFKLADLIAKLRSDGSVDLLGNRLDADGLL